MQKKNWLGVLILLVISAIAYLPLAHKMGYLNDDWYLMYDGLVGGANFFHEVFRGDRPGRALAMIPLFSIFGVESYYYHLSAYLFRFLGGLCLYWTLQMLWEKKQFSNLITALFFTVYPGFLSQINAIDYQSHILGLSLAVASVAFTVKSILSAGKGPRIFYAIASILTGWGYLSQMEYFIGIEAFRFACIFLLMWRTQTNSVREKLQKAALASLAFLLIAVGFLTWRLFFFTSERRATDLSLQISLLFSAPLTGLWWLNYLIQDIFTVSALAWTLPVYLFAFPLRLRDVWMGFGIAAFAAALLVVALHWGVENDSDTESGSRSSERRERLWVALIAITGGLLPIIFANRHVTLPDYSRYTLIASIGAVIPLAVVIENLSSRTLRMTLTGFLVGIAVMTHYGNSLKAVNETESTLNFWWQVSWRAPQIKAGTTLIASYPGSPLSEDYFVWGPANLIYYPEKQNTIPIQVKLPAAILSDDAVLQIITNGGMETPLRRGNYLERDFRNVLVMIQTSSNSCVRFINGDAPELSQYDLHRLLLVAPHSRLDNVVTEGDFKTPPAGVFGEEPERGWCYTYQKADLARQRGDWEQIPDLLEEALDKGYYPEDGLEWMPFLQANAILGDLDKMRSTTKLVITDKFQRLQACDIMTDFMNKETLDDAVDDFIQKKICE